MISNHATVPFARGNLSAPSSLGLAFGRPPVDLHGMAPCHVPIEEVTLRHLRTPEDFASVRALRGHIDLGVHMTVDSCFEEHEKKETSWAWPSLSRSAARCSGQSVQCPCGMA